MYVFCYRSILENGYEQNGAVQQIFIDFKKAYDSVRREILCNTYSGFDMIYLITAIGLTPGGSSTVHIYTQTVHRTKQTEYPGGTYITIGIHTHNNKNT